MRGKPCSVIWGCHLEPSLEEDRGVKKSATEQGSQQAKVRGQSLQSMPIVRARTGLSASV